MRIAVRPPEYMPRLSYVALMKYVDVFVVADTFQYSRQSFQNRARIRTPHGWSWISVPLVGRQHGTPICKTQIDNRSAWQSKHRRAFQYNYGNTVYFPFFEDRITSLYESEWNTLGDLTWSTIKLFHELFSIKCRLMRASQLERKSDSLPVILEQFDFDHYLSPRESFDKDKEGLSSISCFEYNEPRYRQHFEGFEPEITAFDVLCNYGNEAVGVVQVP
ncbi:MAG: WbqC family protein [Rhodothermaceae bacterium]|nr:WbqC family protein [Rhodothermaceae bacterium]